MRIFDAESDVAIEDRQDPNWPPPKVGGQLDVKRPGEDNDLQMANVVYVARTTFDANILFLPVFVSFENDTRYLHELQR